MTSLGVDLKKMAAVSASRNRRVDMRSTNGMHLTFQLLHYSLAKFIFPKTDSNTRVTIWLLLFMGKKVNKTKSFEKKNRSPNTPVGSFSETALRHLRGDTERVTCRLLVVSYFFRP